MTILTAMQVKKIKPKLVVVRFNNNNKYDLTYYNVLTKESDLDCVSSIQISKSQYSKHLMKPGK
jgi:hypothetical protein